jgi:hypothetical protein
MGATPDSPGPVLAGPFAELVAQNGPERGARRRLTGALALLGRAAACDVRLDADGVALLHCAVADGPGGPVLRDLGSPFGTLVNCEAVRGPRALNDGDLVCVGPFEFRVELPEPAGRTAAEDEAARDALRVQAAAVVAQQAELASDEGRLRQRATALERQEAQLAAHLEERRRRLLDVQDQVRHDRDKLRAERERAREQEEALQAEWKLARADADAGREQADKERRRLVELRKRLKRRWRRHWQAQEAALARRERELAAGSGRSQKEAEALEQARRRFNGEAELGRRQLQADWEELTLAQQQWEAALNQEQVERERRAGEDRARAAALAAAEQALRGHEREWQERQAALAREVEGLENRVRNQRQRLYTPPLPSPEGVPPAAAEAPPAVEVTLLPTALQRLADELADQRRHLLEQWQRLVEVQEHWQLGREELLAEIEAAGRRLAERERQLAVEEQAAAAGAAALRQRQESAAQARAALEGERARLTARAAALEGERARLTAEARLREEAAAGELRRLDELRKRWAARRRQELEELRAARGRCEEVRGRYVGLWRECQARRAELAREQQQFAGHQVALERLRLEVLGRAANTAAAERRLEKLRRRHTARFEAYERELALERQAVAEETARLADEARRLHAADNGLAAGRAELDRLRGEADAGQAESESAAARGRLELRRLEAQHEADARELQALRDEVERIARHLLDGGDAAPPLLTNQAA